MPLRVPTPDVSVVDLMYRLEKDNKFVDIDAAIKEAKEGDMNGVLNWTNKEVMSTDFMRCNSSSIFDVRASIALTYNFFEMVSCYDNEEG